MQHNFDCNILLQLYRSFVKILPDNVRISPSILLTVIICFHMLILVDVVRLHTAITRDLLDRRSKVSTAVAARFLCLQEIAWKMKVHQE